MRETTEALNADFRDLLHAFLEGDVDFVIVGAHALAAAGVPRATKDLDVFVRPSSENANRVFESLLRFGAPVHAHGVRPEDFAETGTVYQMGLPPRRIDIVTHIDGVDFETAWSGRTEKEIDQMRLPFRGLDEFVRNKSASGRPRDLLESPVLG